MIPFASQRKDAEDVLSSIRRMVSEEARAKIADNIEGRLELTSADVVAPETLVLTTDQEVERLAAEPVRHPDPIADAITAGRTDDVEGPTAAAATPSPVEPQPASEAAAPEDTTPEIVTLHPAEQAQATAHGGTAPEPFVKDGDAAPEIMVPLAEFDVPPSDIAPMPKVEAAAAASEPRNEVETTPGDATAATAPCEAPVEAHAADAPTADAPIADTPVADASIASISAVTTCAAVESSSGIRNLLLDEIEAEEAPIMDELAMRKIVSEMIREELEGEMGERITRNVRKLIRREIARALSLKS